MARRRGFVWFRRSRNQWFTQMNKKQVPLGVMGPDTPGSRAAAEAAYRALFGPVSTADVAAPPSQPPQPARTVREAVASYLEEKAGEGLSAETLKGYRRYLTWFAARFGTLGVSDLTKKQVEADARGRPWSDDTRRNYLAAIEACLKHAGFPLTLEKPPRGSAGAGAVIPEATYHMAVGAARGDLRPLLVVLWNTGCRPSELRSLTVELVDWANGTATLTKHKTRRRGKAARLVIFPEPAMAVLRAQRDRHKTGLLFRNRRGVAFTMTGLAQQVWRISKRIGKPLTAYGCRHTFATDGLAKGLPDTHVAALLGHGSTRMIHAHYNHLAANSRLLKEAAARVRPAG
jgi:integrase